jgi:hypothetical protein
MRSATVPSPDAHATASSSCPMTGMAWHVALGFVLLVDAQGRISGAWRYGLRGVVPVRVYVA